MSIVNYFWRFLSSLYLKILKKLPYQGAIKFELEIIGAVREIYEIFLTLARNLNFWCFSKKHKGTPLCFVKKSLIEFQRV